MPITTVDDDAGIGFAESVTVYDDDTGAVLMAITTVANGGTGRSKSADGPGFVTQQSLGANLTTLATAIGTLPTGGASGVPTVLAANNTSTRKFLMQVATIANTPVFSWVQPAATDIATGILPFARGGLGSDLTAGFGVLYVDGGALYALPNPTLETLYVDSGASTDVDNLDTVIQVMCGDSKQARVRFRGRTNDTHYWQVLHAVGAAGALGTFAIYNSDVGANAISIDTANAVTLSSLNGANSAPTSPRSMHTLGLPARVTTDGTDSTPVATEFYYAELKVDVNVAMSGIAIFNGSVASGNLKVGLFDGTGAPVATSASTVMSGTDAYQLVPFTGNYTAKGPAAYYVGLFIDNATARFNTHTIGVGVTGKKTGQVFATGFTAITLGTTFTTALGPIATPY